MTDAVLLQALGIRKQYGSVTALAHADFELRRGEVTGLLGQNGAGKSTLVKILSGRLKPDAGTVLLNGVAATQRDLARETSPIAIMEQELSIVPTLTVGQNVFLGNRRIGRWFGARKAARRAGEFLERAGVGHVDPLLPAGRLSVGEQQLVELARALARDAQVLILDEPTAALSDPEIQRVIEVVRQVRGEGRAVVYISHRLNEVRELADRTIVVRDGTTQQPIERDAFQLDRIIEAMLGRPLEAMYPSKAAGAAGAEVLRLDSVLTEGINTPVSLSLKAGTIVGLAGQLGSGAPALLEAIAGTRPLSAGSVAIGGAAARVRNPRDAKDRGIAYCSGDRKLDGVFAVRSVEENLTSPAIERCAHGGWISPVAERSLAEEISAAFGIDVRRMHYRVDSLSGGNQQKVAVGKWLAVRPNVLLMNEPTRGVDVGARADIYRFIRGLANEGLAIMFASSDADEVIGLADTVVSFYRSAVVRVAAACELDVAQLTRDLSSPPAPAREPENVS